MFLTGFKSESSFFSITGTIAGHQGFADVDGSFSLLSGKSKLNKTI